MSAFSFKLASPRVLLARCFIATVVANFLACACQLQSAVAEDAPTGHTGPDIVGPDIAGTDSAAASNPTTPAMSKLESWIGGDATHRYGAIWTGLTWSPFRPLDEPGWRLRAVTGAGLYTFDGWTLSDGLPTPARFRGRSLFGDALLGYQFQLGRLTLKPFAGITIVQHDVWPTDPVSQTAGRTAGLKLALDTWLWVSNDLWLAADGSWTAVHDTAAVKMRMGYRVWGDLSAGIETTWLTDVNQELRRAGLHLRYGWQRGEISLGAGVTGTSWLDAARSHTPYVSITLLGKF